MNKKELKIPATQYKILKYLIENKSKTSQSEIAYELNISAKTVRQCLYWLENCYIIKRKFNGMFPTEHEILPESEWEV